MDILIYSDTSYLWIGISYKLFHNSSNLHQELLIISYDWKKISF